MWAGFWKLKWGVSRYFRYIILTNNVMVCNNLKHYVWFWCKQVWIWVATALPVLNLNFFKLWNKPMVGGFTRGSPMTPLLHVAVSGNVTPFILFSFCFEQGCSISGDSLSWCSLNSQSIFRTYFSHEMRVIKL